MKIYLEPYDIPEMVGIPVPDRKRVWRAFMETHGSSAKGQIIGFFIFMAFFVSGAFLAETLADSYVYFSFITVGLFLFSGLVAFLHTAVSFLRKPFKEFCATPPAILIRELRPVLEPYPKVENWPISPIRVAQLVGVLKRTAVFLSPFLVFGVIMTFFVRNMNVMLQFGVGLGWDPWIVLIGTVLSLIGVPVLYWIFISSWLKRTDFIKKTEARYYLDRKRYSLRWLEAAFLGSLSFVSFVISLVVVLLARSYQLSGQLMPDGHGKFITFLQGYLVALLFLVFSVTLLKGVWDFSHAPEEHD